jgi:hypothetical protein
MSLSQAQPPAGSRVFYVIFQEYGTLLVRQFSPESTLKIMVQQKESRFFRRRLLPH